MVTIKNLTDILEEISAHEEVNVIFNELNTHYGLLYRGVSNVDYELLPGALRKNTDKEAVYKFGEKNSRAIALHFKKHASYILGNNIIDNNLNLLTYAQHFGVPTKLLDFTSNPLISIFFACADDSNKNNDGAIYILNTKSYHHFSLKKDPEMYKKSNDVIAKKMVDELFDKKLSTEIPYWYIPQYIDKRMAAQSSVFFIWGKDHRDLSKIVNPNPDILNKIIIPKEVKERVLIDLFKVGMNHSVVYPDLDGLGKFISAYHKLF